MSYQNQVLADDLESDDEVKKVWRGVERQLKAMGDGVFDIDGVKAMVDEGRNLAGGPDSDSESTASDKTA